MIKVLAHVCILASDLAATERFYCSGLGLEKLFDFTRDGEVVGFYLKVSGRTYVEVFHRDEAPGESPSPIRHLCFEVDDIDEASDRLRSEGYEITEKKLGADQSWQAWTSDPGGVSIELHQYTEESCQVTGRDCVLG